MSGPDPHLPPDDRELEDFLAGRGPHARRYRESASEVAPPSLDAAILARARAAVAAPRPRVRRWQLPVSLAATVVLGIGLASRVQHDADRAPEVAAAPAATQVEAPVVVMAEIESAPSVPTSTMAAPADAAPAEAERREARPAAKREMPPAPMAARSEAMTEPQALADDAAGAPVVVAAPPPPPPAPPMPAPAPEAMADAASSRATEAAVMARPAPPSVAAFAAAPRMKSLAPSQAAPALPRLPDGEYRNAAGDRLQLLADRGFRLLPMDAQEPRYRGSRVAVEGGERLQVLPAEGSAGECALQVRITPEADVLELRTDCAGTAAGLYRRVAESERP